MVNVCMVYVHYGRSKRSATNFVHSPVLERCWREIPMLLFIVLQISASFVQAYFNTRLDRVCDRFQVA